MSTRTRKRIMRRVPLRVSMTFLARQMAGRRTKLSDRKKTTVRSIASETQKHVLFKKKEELTVLSVLQSAYPKLGEDDAREIASLRILHPLEDWFESLLEDIVKSFSIDREATLKLLKDNSDIDDIMLLLPSTRGLEYLHTRAVEEEFQAVGGAIMRFPCRDCGGFEFYFDPDRHIGAADEASREQMFCKKCKPRYS